MNNIDYQKSFIKHFQKRINPHPKLVRQFRKRLALFIEKPNHPLLKDHQLKGNKLEYRSFSVTGDIRVIYKIENNRILLYDIGSHNQVY